jgi:drug/metabolite transporter (DMT)-like permease
MGSLDDLSATTPRRSQAFASAMLVVACLCWASFFSLAKHWLNGAKSCPGGDLIASLTLIGLRPVLALLVIALVRPGLFLQPTSREWLVASFLGLLILAGNVYQVWGLTHTTPARSSFFTSMASAWVPVIGLVAFRVVPPLATWLGLILGIIGVGVLGLNPEDGWSLSRGDGLTLISSLLFAAYILCLDRFGRQVRPGQLTLGLIAVGNLPALPLACGLAAHGEGIEVWAAWLGDMLSDPQIVMDVVLLTLLSTVLATFVMSTFQPRVSASRAALIYLLEPVFAAALSVLVRHDSVTPRLLLGGMLILGGNALVELHVWLRSERVQSA